MMKRRKHRPMDKICAFRRSQPITTTASITLPLLLSVVFLVVNVVIDSSCTSTTSCTVAVLVTAYSLPLPSLLSSSVTTSTFNQVSMQRRRKSHHQQHILWDSFDGQCTEESSCLGEMDCDKLKTDMIARVKFEVLTSINDVEAEVWDECCSDKDSSPFVQHAWLRCLEESDCASPQTGWTPHHIQIKLGRDICGFVPCYLKDNSMGEFIFDNVFADAAQRNGLTYYPKLLVGVPFTPVTGTRILLHPRKLSESQRTSIRLLVCIYLKKIAADDDLSSVHINFATNAEIENIAGPIRTTQVCDGDNKNENENTERQSSVLSSKQLAISNNPSNASFMDKVKSFFWKTNSSNSNERKDAKFSPTNPNEKVNEKDCDSRGGDSTTTTTTATTAIPKLGYLRRISIQYHWHNRNYKMDGRPYTSFEEYLSAFKSKRRISIRREREKILKDEGIRIDIITGRDIMKYDGLVDRMYLIYRSTVDKMLLGRQYLSYDFFTRLAHSPFVDNLCFLTARRSSSGEVVRAQDVIAGTINCVKDSVFYGRYWGCLEDVKNLHFECCYWSALEYCIDNGFTRMEPGAGGGDYKWARGFDSALVHSAHYFSHPGLHRAACAYLDYETESVLDLYGFLSQNSVVAAGVDAGVLGHDVDDDSDDLIV